ncbi:MAG: hypothetical protein KME04_15210 [Pleurocapsa minor GSE-CHR-MK-17-07R]|jgi:hypothetical protein|nr:hypothetical protein [Pleurocapsa minor GSE-CHR-MK 17-07R]
MHRFLRLASLVSGFLYTLLALGFAFQISWVVALFPWNLSYLSAIFIASILLAIAIPTLWIGWKGEIGSVFGGAIDLTVTFIGMGVFSIQLYFGDTSRQSILVFGILALLSAAALAGIAWKSWGIALKDKRPTPRFVRISFALFAVTLLLAGGALILKTNNIFPWNIGEELRVLYGWIFLGAMCYFIFALIKPQWGNAKGQLMGFLAYDLVLIVPFLQHFEDVIPEQRLSLTIYVGVMVFSGVLAAYFLFIDKRMSLFSASGNEGRPMQR